MEKDMHNKHTQQRSFQNICLLLIIFNIWYVQRCKKAFELLSSRRVIGIRFMDTLLEGSLKI